MSANTLTAHNKGRNEYDMTYMAVIVVADGKQVFESLIQCAQASHTTTCCKCSYRLPVNDIASNSTRSFIVATNPVTVVALRVVRRTNHHLLRFC